MRQHDHQDLHEHPRLRRERETVKKMIGIYCRANHTSPAAELCSECQNLVDYTHERIDHCPYQPDKPTCVNCQIHCYNRDNREKIRAVMRFAGPRMLFYHPWLTFLHLLDGLHKPHRKY